MKRSYIFGFMAAMTALLACGCEKTTKVGANDAAKKYFDAWLMINYPEATKVDPGIYVISETPGRGLPTGDPDVFPYVRVNYIKTDLKGNIDESNLKTINQQLGSYTYGNYYGPKVWYRGGYSLPAGIETALSDMRAGGTKKVIIPGWLSTYNRYESEEEYLKNATGTSSIYTIEVKDVIADITQWEIDSLERFVRFNMHGVDSTKYGFYYLQTQAPEDPDAEFVSSDQVYINYTGRLLNGQVFDTTLKDTAKVWNIYSSGKTYEPTYVTWSTDYSEMILGSGTTANMIDGFAYCVSLMKKGEKGICAFYSDLGYGSSGSDELIPGYSPIAYEIEVIGVEE